MMQVPLIGNRIWPTSNTLLLLNGNHLKTEVSSTDGDHALLVRDSASM